MGKIDTGGESAPPRQLPLGGDASWGERPADPEAFRPSSDAALPTLDPDAPPGERGSIAILQGVAAAEEALFSSIDVASSAMQSLDEPIRIVVPSGALRDHLARALVRRRGRALLGVSIQTHYSLALETLERIGEAPRPGRSYGALLAQRLIREVPELRRVAGGYRRGWEGVRASLRDLLDAGFRPAHLDAALECLSEAGEGPAQARVAALLRGAAWCVERHEATRHPDAALLLECATAALGASGSALLPTTMLAVYGVADATGALADWIETLLHTYAGTLVLNQPADPAKSDRAESRYSEDFIARLEARELARIERPSVSSPPRAGELPLLICADSPRAEAGEVARRVRGVLDEGVEPEEIAICARRFDDYRAPLIEALDTWAIPFSAEGLSSSGGADTRVVNALAQLLRVGPLLAIDAWATLDARLGGDLRTALHQLGIADLATFCADEGEPTAFAAGSLALGTRENLKTPRRVSRSVFARARVRARAALRSWGEWPLSASASEHRAHLRTLWSALDPPVSAAAHRAARDRLDRLAAELPDDEPISRDAWWLWFVDCAEAVAPPEPGGRGAGVQVLSVTAARERRFSQLFVMGLARENFPRPVADDPLFPEPLRLRLRSVLPDLPLKRRGHDEERHLFASLLGSADRVTLSRSAFTATGREWPESPLLLRLRLAHSSWREEFVQSAVTQTALLPVENAAAAAALDRDDAALAALLPATVAARQSDRATASVASTPDSTTKAAGVGNSAERVAGALRAVWEELDRAPQAEGEPPLGPFFGWVGPPATAHEPFVTEVADLLRCPWQRFLRRELRVAVPPDAGGRLPALDARLRGSAVHKVLERVVEDATGGEATSSGDRGLETRIAAGSRPLRWPEPATLETWMLDAATEVARREGMRGEVFPRLLARSLAPALERARELDELRHVEVFGAELDGSAVLPGSEGAGLRFRADRVEAGPTGPVFVEFKSGRNFLDRVHESTRIRVLADHFASGQGIQVPAYLHAPGAAASRLVFLGPGTPMDQRETSVEATHSEVLEPFLERADAALRALGGGFRPPRLTAKSGRGEGEPCGFCEMRIACLQGDSTQLSRMRDRAQAPRDREDADPLHLLFGSSGSTR